MKKMFKLWILALSLFGLISCNEDSGFEEGRKPILKKGSSDQDAVPETPKNNVESRNIIDSETFAEARKPGDAETAIYSYIASQEMPYELSITLDNTDIATDFNLLNRYSDRSENFRQVNRTPLSQMFKQGNPGQNINETFDQSAVRGIVDILIVVDNSGSMSQEQNNLSSKLEALLSFLTQTSWRIGVVTTTAQSSCNISIINFDDPNASSRFRTAVQAGTNGSGNEQGIYQAVNGLQCTGNPWVRPNSTVAVLIVSDEDNCSNGGGCANQPWVSEQYLINHVENTMGRTVGQNAGFYGIFSSPLMPCRTADFNANIYQRLVDYKANGEQRWGNICDADYSQTLRKISENISSLLRSQWELSQTPDPGSTVSVSIELNGSVTPANPNQYTLNGRTLTFLQGSEPPLGSKIRVSYVVGAIPMFDDVTLSERPADNTVRVMINGTVQSSNQFTVNNQKITFNNRPAANANIQIDYRRNIPLVNAFTIVGTPKNNQIQVAINGQNTNDFTYNAATKTVSFATALADNIAFNVSYVNYDGPQLTYPILLSGSNPRNFKLFYNNDPVNFSRTGNVITIGAADHQEGRTLSFRYEIDDLAEKSFQLPQVPLDGSLTIESNTMPCNLGNGFEIVDQMLISRCVVQDQTQFQIRYQYLISKTTFAVDGLQDPNKFVWEIFIDGEPTTEFTRVQNEITLAQEPSIGARVEVYLTPYD